MAARPQSNSGRNGRQAATRRFPTRGAQIDALLARDEDFRGICDDLAAAEAALAVAEDLPGPLRAERCREYEELITDLAGEIAKALERANVFPMTRMPKRGVRTAEGE